MKKLYLNEEKISVYDREFKKEKEMFSYGYKWVEGWADKELYGGKSLKDILVWNGHTLWYFYEYFIRDSSRVLEGPLLSFSRVLYKIDFYLWLVKGNKPEEIILSGVDSVDYFVLRKIGEKEGIDIVKNKIKKDKKKFYHNKFLVIFFIKIRLFFRFLLSFFHKRNRDKKDVFILTNDRHTLEGVKDDLFFGSIIKELDKEEIDYKMVEYDRPHSFNNLRKTIRRYFLRKQKSNFIGDYYDVRLIFNIFKKGKKFGELGRNIMRRSEFKDSLSYKGINFYPLVKDSLDYIFGVLSYYVADVLVSTRKMLEEEKPSIVLLEHEKNFYDKGFIVNARKKDTNTICFEGELVYDKNDYLRSTKTKEMNKSSSSLWRPLPDLKLLWGDCSKKWFVKEAHYPTNALKIIGAPKYDSLVENLSDVNEDKVYDKLGFDEKKKIFLIITGSLSWEKKYLRTAIECLSNYDGQVIIKLHPNEDPNIKSTIKNYLSKFGVEDYAIVCYIDFKDLLAVSDLVITYESTIGYEVLIAGKPMVVVNFGNSDFRLPYAIGKIVPLAVSQEELQIEVNRIIEGDFSSFSKKSDDFLEKHFFALDGKASERAVKVIKDML